MARSARAKQQRPGSVAPATLAQILGYRFHALGIGVTLRDAKDWHAISTNEGVAVFEFAHGKDMERLAYNRRLIALAER